MNVYGQRQFPEKERLGRQPIQYLIHGVASLTGAENPHTYVEKENVTVKLQSPIC